MRDVSTLDEIGDAETVRETAYGSIKANVQAESTKTEVKYEIQGKLHIQTHKAYFNRFEDDVQRQIVPGDYAVDLETNKSYLILSVLDYQAANSGISDSHHIKLIMATTDGEFYANMQANITSKARIA